LKVQRRFSIFERFFFFFEKDREIFQVFDKLLKVLEEFPMAKYKPELVEEKLGECLIRSKSPRL
jgi:hypothetical protein